jgi:predicted nucleotidyltransferase component of viral defense system
MAINYQLQDKFLDLFFSGPFAQDFYLTGGTALARFYFHHRESIDLDMFTNNQDVDFSSLDLYAKGLFPSLGVNSTKEVVTDTFLQYLLENNSGQTLKIDFIKDIPVHFGPIKTIGKIRLDSLENIGSNKILALFGRTEAKDFIDLYYLIMEAKLDFNALCQEAKQKDLGFSEFYLANSLDRLSEITTFPQLLKPLDKEKMVAFYQDLTKKLLSQIKPQE